MKKIAILFILFYISCANTVFAWECNKTCKIKDGTPDVITNFITNQRILVNNITEVLYKSEPKKSISSDISNISTKLQKSFSIFLPESYKWYYSYFNFYVTYPLQNEYVYEIWRDYDLLEQESKWIQTYYEYVVSNWYTDINLDKDICKWVTNCDYSWNIIDVLNSLKYNLDILKDYYRESITSKNDYFAFEKYDLDKDLRLVDKDFKSNFDEYYNWNTTSDCSSCDWSFTDRFKKLSYAIIDYQNSYKDWIQEWKNAIDLLNWDVDNYDEIERELLSQELWNQWIWWSQADTILRNLDKYNKNWFVWSLKNNYITNSFEYVMSNVYWQWNEFYENVLTNFPDDNTQSVSVYDFWKSKSDLATRNWLDQKIAYLYYSELPSAQIQDNTAWNFISKLIEMHTNLSLSNKTLEKLIKISQKICNSQAFWIWKCEY